MASATRLVILLNIEQESFANELMAGQIQAFANEECELVEATTEAGCVDLLRHGHNGTRARGVYVACAAILEPPYDTLSSVLAGFVREGGIVVLGGMMSSFSAPAAFNRWMQNVWDLPWRFADYQRDDSQLNVAYITHKPLVKALHALPDTINVKAVYLENVRAPDMVYTMTSSSRAQTPVALMKRGKGYLGWVGDVNTAENVTVVYLAMFGLIKGVGQSKEGPLAASMTVCKGCGRGQDDLEASERLQRCTGCRDASYCGRQCQRDDYMVHKTICGVAA